MVCSTDTPSSEWVDREVSTFIELGRAEHIFPLLISGDPEVSFPPSLKQVPGIMDRVMDIRTPGNSVRKMLAKEDPELLKIIADVAGCPLRELQREHSLRKTRRVAARAGAAAAGFLLVGAASLGLMNQARDYRDRAQAAERSSMQMLQELTYELPDRLTAVPGAYSKISGILEENARQINEILLLSTDKTSARYDVAANYEKLATAMSVLGSYTEAADYQQQAIDLYTQLRGEDGNLAPLASAKNNFGRVLNAAGRYEEAAEAFREAIELQRQIPEDRVTLAAMLSNAGANAISLDAQEEAIACFRECGELLAGADDSSYETLSTRAGCAYNHGVLLYRRGEYAEAEALLSQAVEAYTGLCGRVDSPQNRNSLSKALSGHALCLSDQGSYDAAIADYRQAISLSQALAEDAENTDALSTLAELYNNCGICLNNQGNFAEADEYFSSAAELYGKVYETTGTALDEAIYASALLNSGENAFKAEQYPRSQAQFRQGLELLAEAAEELGDACASSYYAWASYNALIHGKNPVEAVDLGVRAVQLQPGSVLANINLGYACLYAGYYEDCDRLLTWAAGLGEGVADAIRLDLKVQSRAGLTSPHTKELLALLP